MRVDLHAARGQASLEWLAVIALVATLLGLGAALAQASTVGRRVTREMVRALCLVRHGDCARDRDPCVVFAAHERHGMVVHVLFVRLGDQRVARVERRSDGTYAVTRATEAAFGLEGHAGVGAGVKVAGLEAEVSVGIAAAETLAHEGGDTWIVGSRDAAEDLLRRLPGELGLPPADVVYGTTDLRSTVGATVGAEAVVSLEVAGVQLSFDRRVGQRLDRRTGRRTLFVRSSREHAATLGEGVLGLSGAAGGELYAIELDASGRPLDLQVVSAGALRGSRDLPDVLQPVAGRLAVGGDDRRYEVTAHLDLTEAGNLAAAAELLDAMRRRGPRLGGMPEATRALRRRIDERGTVEARVLRSQATSRELELSATLGVKVGAEISSEVGTERLVAAVSRGLDGQWLVREDCVSGR